MTITRDQELRIKALEKAVDMHQNNDFARPTEILDTAKEIFAWLRNEH